MPIDLEKDQVYIKLPDKVHGTYGICIFLSNKNLNKIRLFKFNMAYHLNSLKIKWFLQGGGRNTEVEWCYFELITEIPEYLILEIAETIANEMNLPLEIE